jgi:hypothetical protein
MGNQAGALEDIVLAICHCYDVCGVGPSFILAPPMCALVVGGRGQQTSGPRFSLELE